MTRFTHLDDAGNARMVDVTAKTPTVRSASAVASVRCSAEVVQALRDGTVPKGDVLAVARVAGIAAAKKVPDLLPLAHVIGVHGVVVDLKIVDEGIDISATVRTADRTGVEMEALTAVTVAALAVVDMIKGVDKLSEIVGAKVVAKVRRTIRRLVARLGEVAWQRLKFGGSVDRPTIWQLLEECVSKLSEPSVRPRSSAGSGVTIPTWQRVPSARTSRARPPMCPSRLAEDSPRGCP